MSRVPSGQRDVATVPFSRLLGLTRAGTPSEPGLGLPFRDELTNHLGTMHASAQLALAEAASGECLQQALPELTGRALAVVRGVEARFRAPATSDLRAATHVQPRGIEKLRAALARRGVGRIEVAVELRDAAGAITLTAHYEWLLRDEAGS
jgi:acyl-coenzyme A thioesterase PaaI-like protein